MHHNWEINWKKKHIRKDPQLLIERHFCSLTKCGLLNLWKPKKIWGLRNRWHWLGILNHSSCCMLRMILGLNIIYSCINERSRTICLHQHKRLNICKKLPKRQTNFNFFDGLGHAFSWLVIFVAARDLIFSHSLNLPPEEFESCFLFESVFWTSNTYRDNIFNCSFSFSFSNVKASIWCFLLNRVRQALSLFRIFLRQRKDHVRTFN